MGGVIVRVVSRNYIRSQSEYITIGAGYTNKGRLS